MTDTEKLRSAFPDTTVFKDPQIVAIFMAASIPSFLRDWILKRKSESDGRIHDAEALRRYIYDIIPRREDLLNLQIAARTDGCSKKFLAKVEIQFSVRSNECTFAIPELGRGFYRGRPNSIADIDNIQQHPLARPSAAITGYQTLR